MKTISTKKVVGISLIGIAAVVAIIFIVTEENKHREVRCATNIEAYNNTIYEHEAELDRLEAEGKLHAASQMHTNLVYAQKKLEILKKLKRDNCAVGYKNED